MADEQTKPHDVRAFYFENFERRDAELVQLRDSVYTGDTRKMLATYEERLKHPNANVDKLRDDIDRLRHISDLETQIAQLQLTVDGAVLTSVSPLVNKYEPERRRGGNGHGLASLLL